MACITCGRSIREERIWTCDTHKLKFGFCVAHTTNTDPQCPRGARCKLVRYSGKAYRDKAKLNEFTWHAPAYLAQVREVRAELKTNIRNQMGPAQDVGPNLVEIMTHDFIITHETTWLGLYYMMGRGGADCQARIIKHAPQTQSTHRDSVMGGGHFVYTRVISTRGPQRAISDGSTGASSPIMLVFHKNIVRDRWMDMFGAATDLYGAIGTGAQTSVTASGIDRGALALGVVLSELTRTGGPTVNNEFGFFSRIDFRHLRAIVVKLGQASTGKGIDLLPRAEKAEMNKVTSAVLSQQRGRIAPKTPRNGSNVYGTLDAPVAADMTAALAFSTAFGHTIDSLVVGLAKTTPRSSVPTKLTAYGV